MYLSMDYHCCLQRLHITEYIGKTSKPVGFQLSSNIICTMHMTTIFIIINNHLYIPCLTDIFGFLNSCQKFGNCTHINNALEVLSGQSQIFYICKQYLFLHNYYSFSIPCLAVIFVFCKCLGNFTPIHIYFTIGSHRCSFTSLKLTDSLFGRHISFSLYMPISFKIRHMCIYTKYECPWSVKLTALNIFKPIFDP